MSLTLSLTSDVPLPGVLVVIPGSDLPAGDPWVLTVSTAGGWWSRVPRGGRGTGAGEQVVLVDRLAPVNETLTYSLVVAGVVVDSGTVTRPWGLVGDLITDLGGATVAVVSWKATGGDVRSTGRRGTATTVPGWEFPVLRLAPVAGAGTGSMTVTAAGQHADTVADLLRTNRPLVRFHDPSRCDFPGCRLDPVTLLWVSADRSDVVQRYDRYERVYELGFLVVGDPNPLHVAPLSTWDDFDDALTDDTWDDFDALLATWDAFDATDWRDAGV